MIVEPGVWGWGGRFDGHSFSIMLSCLIVQLMYNTGLHHLGQNAPHPSIWGVTVQNKSMGNIRKTFDVARLTPASGTALSSFQFWVSGRLQSLPIWWCTSPWRKWKPRYRNSNYTLLWVFCEASRISGQPSDVVYSSYYCKWLSSKHTAAYTSFGSKQAKWKSDQLV